MAKPQSKNKTVLTLEDLKGVDLRWLLQSMGDKFWEQFNFKDILLALTEGMRGNIRPSLMIQEEIYNLAVEHIKKQIRQLKKDPQALEKQQRSILDARKVHTLSGLRRMDPKRFEFWTAGYFLDQEFPHAWVVPPGPDAGTDIFLTCPDGKPAIVQCKRYDAKHVLGRPLIDQFFTVLHRFHVRRGYIVTTSSFSKDAVECVKEYGKKYAVNLLDNRDILPKTLRKSPANKPAKKGA